MYRGLLDRMDAGAECRRLEPLLSKLVDDELAAAERSDVELHLGNCGTCRAVVRDYGDAPREIASLFPVGAAAGGFAGSLADAWGNAAAWLNERLPTQRRRRRPPRSPSARSLRSRLSPPERSWRAGWGRSMRSQMATGNATQRQQQRPPLPPQRRPRAASRSPTEAPGLNRRSLAAPSAPAARRPATCDSWSVSSSGSARTSEGSDPPPRFVEPEPQSEPLSNDQPDPVENSEPPSGDLVLP